MNQVWPSPRGYHQNTYAQEASTAAAAGAGAAYTGQAGPYQHNEGYDPRYDYDYDYPAYQPYNHAGDDRYSGYDDSGRPYSLSPSRTAASQPRRHSRDRRDHSPSSGSYTSMQTHGGDDRGRRPTQIEAGTTTTADPKRAKSSTAAGRAGAGGGRGKSKSRIREAFDTSQRGLGYAGIGALAGGLVGSEVGKGIVPTALAAAVGALGANAFEARDRYVPNGFPSPTTVPMSMQTTEPMRAIDPRMPLNAQLYRPGEGGRGMPPMRG